MSAPVVEKQESKDANLFLHTKTASENERDNDASVGRKPSVDRQQAQFGNAAVASLPAPRPMAWVHRGFGNSAISRVVQRSIAAKKTPQENGKAKPNGQLKPQDGGNHAPTQLRQREEASEGVDRELPNAGQSVASENEAAQGASALGQATTTSDMPGSVASAESVFQQFATASATQIATRIGGTGETLRKQFQRDRDTFVERSPSVRVAIATDVAGEKRAASAGPAAISKLPTAESIVLGAASPETPLSADETTVKPQPGDNQLQTDAGATPVFRADGEAAPDRMKPAAIAASSTAHQAGAQILSEINGNTAKDRMVVAPVDRAETIELPQTTAAPVAKASGEMLEYLYTDVGSDVRAIADSDFAPILDQTLAGPRVQVETAAAERDANRERAYIEAQAEADATSTEAEKQQHLAIADGQSAVEAEKQIGLRDQQALLDKFDTDAKEKYRTQNKEIDTLVREEQGKADQEISDGNAKAEKLAKEAKEEEARERAEREKSKPKKKKKKWYQKVGDWFKNAIREWTDKLVSAVKTVFDKAKKLVNDALAAAKRVAVGIINKLRDKVVGLIKTFAAGLKVLVNVLLVAFPKLRDKVNAAIDTVVEKAIEVVDAIAQKLEDTVVALIDRVQSVVTKIMDLCELVIVTQLQIAGALLTGDFLQAAKILFLAACKAVGIPGEEFLSILSDARDAFMDIIKHPARFLKSLIKSIGQGMGKFMSGFRGHFIGGITGWLFGAVAAGGISLPKTFSLKSVFSLLLQVLGFTYDYIRGVAVRVVGERNVAIVEDVTLKVKTLFTDGPGMIWDWIKDKASEIKQKIIDSVSEWLITQLIMKAATKLATMFTPVGAFVQAVLMMYNTIMFFIERIKQIFAWVKSITGSFTRMAKGMVSAAAAWIEQAMAKSIPLIISFLARLVGLGGIGAKVKSVVTKIRQPIDKAIVFVIEKLVAIGQKVWGGLKATGKKIANWWNAKEEFHDEQGKKHHLYLEKEADGKTPRLIVASDPTEFEEHLRMLRSQGRATEAEELEPCYVPFRRDQATIRQGTGNETRIDPTPHMKKIAAKKDKSGGEDKSEKTVGEQLFAGALLGDFQEDPSYWNMIGQAAIGFTPVGIAADIRDVVAALHTLFFKQKYGDIGAWLALGLAIVGFIPGIGDLIKLGGKAALKWMRSNGVVGWLIEKAVSVIKSVVSAASDIVSLLFTRFKSPLADRVSKLQQEFQDNVFAELSGFRPNFSDRIKTELASDHSAAPYAHLHEPGTRHKTQTINGDKQHRRHETPYKRIRDELLQTLDGLNPREMAEVLGGKGFVPKTMDKDGITKAAKDYLKWKNDDYANLWVGSGRENLRIGAKHDPEPGYFRNDIGEAALPSQAELLEGVEKNFAEGNVVSGTLLQTIPHAKATDVRTELGLSGKTIESAHGAPKSAMKDVAGYDPRKALTVLLPKKVHREIDRGWMVRARSLVAEGKFAWTAQEMVDAVSASINRSTLLSESDKSSLIEKIKDEVFVGNALQPSDSIRLPYAKDQ